MLLCFIRNEYNKLGVDDAKEKKKYCVSFSKR